MRLVEKCTWSAILLLLALVLMPAAVMASDSTAVIPAPQAIADPYSNHDNAYILHGDPSSRRLSYIDQNLYNDILNAMLNLDDVISVPGYTSEELFATRQQVLDDHSEIFYFEHKDSFWWPDGRLEFKYRYEPDVIKTMRDTLSQKVTSIITAANVNGGSDLEKELALHDYLVTHTAYDQAGLDSSNIPELDYTAYGIIVDGSGVCEGYARAMQLLLDQFSIKSRLLRSTPAMKHAWNLVLIDGQWYHLDVTWDDPVPDQGNRLNYTYFNQSDTVMEKDHYWDHTVYQVCDSDRFTAFNSMSHPVHNSDYMYYSNESDQGRLYKSSLDGTDQQCISNIWGQFLVLDGEWIYFSNYTNSGYLYKMKTDGNEVTPLNSVYSINLQRVDRILYYTIKNTGEIIPLELVPIEETPVTNISLNKNSFQLYMGSSPFKLIPTVTPSSAANLVWTSDNPAVAKVGNDGSVSAVSAGTAVITVSSAAGSVTAQCTVTIKAMPPAPLTGLMDTKYDQPIDKLSWTIRFNQPANGVNNETVSILDADNYPVDANIVLDSTRTLATITATQNYKPGELYFVCISDAVHSDQGKKLASPVVMPFVIAN